MYGNMLKSSDTIAPCTLPIPIQNVGLPTDMYPMLGLVPEMTSKRPKLGLDHLAAI